MNCTHTRDCQLYAQLAMEPSLGIWKKRYCRDAYEKCARYQLALKGEAIPLTLLPNGKKLEKRSKSEVAAAALFNAILKQRVPMVKAMLKTGMPSKRIITKDKMTPLMAAASVGNLELVTLMLEHGCNPFMTNSNGQTALEIAIEADAIDCQDAILNACVGKTAEDFEAAAANVDNEVHNAVDETSTQGVMGLLKKLNPFNAA